MTLLPSDDLPKVICAAVRTPPPAVIRLAPESPAHLHPWHVDPGSTVMLTDAWTGRMPLVLTGAASATVGADLTVVAKVWVPLPPPK